MGKSRGNFSSQLTAYQMLTDSFNASLKVSEGLIEEIGSSVKTFREIYNSLVHSIGVTQAQNSSLGDINAISNTLREFYETQKSQMEELIELNRQFFDNEDLAEDYANNIRDATREASRFVEDTFQESTNNIKDSFSKVLEELRFSENFSYIQDQGERLSVLTNQMMQATGMSHEEAVTFRGQSTDLVKGLNNRTGNKFNAVDYYEDLVSIANTTNISNRNTLLEISEPIITAQKSMGADINQLAKLSGRLVDKYEYSGNELSDYFDYVRNATAGNLASIDQVMDNTNSIIDTILDVSAGDKDMSKRLLQGVADTTVFLEGIYQNTSKYTDLIQGAWEGDMSSIEKLVKLGVYDEVMKAKETGDFEGASLSVLQSYSDLYEKYKDNRFASTIISDSYGLDYSMSRDAYRANHEGEKDIYQQFDEFKRGKEDISNEDAVKNQYQSVAEGWENQLSELAPNLAGINEKTGGLINKLPGLINSMINSIDLNTISNYIVAGSNGAGGLGNLFRGRGGSAAASSGGGLLSRLTGGLRSAGNVALTATSALGEGLITAGGGSVAGMGAGSLAATGLGSVAGAGLGLAGLVSGGKNFWSALTGKKNGQELTSEERQDEAFKGTAKTGMVGGGAAIGAAIGSVIPGLGTLVGGLVGAGVGGIGALLGGNKVGEWLSGKWDETKESLSGFWDKLKEGASSIKEKAAEGWESAKENISGIWTKFKEGSSNLKEKITSGWKDSEDDTSSTLSSVAKAGLFAVSPALGIVTAATSMLRKTQAEESSPLTEKRTALSHSLSETNAVDSSVSQELSRPASQEVKDTSIDDKLLDKLTEITTLLVDWKQYQYNHNRLATAEAGTSAATGLLSRWLSPLS